MSGERVTAEHHDPPWHWREAGNGDPVIFLHPIVGTAHYWEPQISELSDSWRCIALNSPGYGASERVAGIAAARTTERLIGFLDALCIERADVVGLSLGGTQALNAVSDFPDRFGRLVLADTSAAFGGPATWLRDWLSPLRRGARPSEVAVEAIDQIVHLNTSQITTFAIDCQQSPTNRWSSWVNTTAKPRRSTPRSWLWV